MKRQIRTSVAVGMFGAARSLDTMLERTLGRLLQSSGRSSGCTTVRHVVNTDGVALKRRSC